MALSGGVVLLLFAGSAFNLPNLFNLNLQVSFNLYRALCKVQVLLVASNQHGNTCHSKIDITYHVVENVSSFRKFFFVLRIYDENYSACAWQKLVSKFGFKIVVAGHV